ncbi:hypothetical protein Bbelb_193260 [Branchiostoma belcheri]|nr:hypothetical protein Bbelb_193260 [Branchiostoma belcheri]
MAEQVTSRFLDKLYATMEEAALQPVCNYQKLTDMATAWNVQSLRLDLEWLLHRQGQLETRMERLLKEGNVVVEGLPEGFKLRKPSDIGTDDLKVLLNHRNSIAIHYEQDNE